MPWTAATLHVSDTGDDTYEATIHDTNGVVKCSRRPFEFTGNVLFAGSLPQAGDAEGVGKALWASLADRDAKLAAALVPLLEQDGVVLRIVYTHSSRAAALPWELLHGPDAYVLHGNHRTEIVRVPQIAKSKQCMVLSLAQASRVACLGDPTMTLNIAAERKILREHGFDDSAKDLSHLETALGGPGPFVVHIGAHGYYHPIDTPPALLHGPGVRDFVGPQTARALIGPTNAPKIGLFVLNSCELANAPLMGARGLSFPSSLLWGGVGSVVAMGYEVADRIALLFAEKFYEKLATSSIVDALHHVRRILLQEYPTTAAPPYWALPRLFAQLNATPWKWHDVPSRIVITFKARIPNLGEFQISFTKQFGPQASLDATEGEPNSVHVTGSRLDLLANELRSQAAWLLAREVSTVTADYSDGSKELLWERGTVAPARSEAAASVVGDRSFSPSSKEPPRSAVRRWKKAVVRVLSASVPLVALLVSMTRPCPRPPDEVKSAASRTTLGSSTGVPPLSVNYPWRCYGHDFGTVPGSTHDGVSSSEATRVIERDFAYLADNGVRYVTWFLLGDGRVLPVVPPANGLQLPARFIDDYEKLLQLAGRYKIGILWTLLDYRFLVNDAERPALGGRSEWIRSKASRDVFLSSILRPMLARDTASIVGWIVINEPEHAVRLGSVTRHEVETFVSEACDAISKSSHGASNPAPCGIGVSDAAALDDWVAQTQVHLDFVSVHYYPQVPANTVAAAPSLLPPPTFFKRRARGHAPIIILGEYDAKHLLPATGLYATMASTLGYENATPWSFRTLREHEEIADGCESSCENAQCLNLREWQNDLTAGWRSGRTPETEVPNWDKIRASTLADWASEHTRLTRALQQTHNEKDIAENEAWMKSKAIEITVLQQKIEAQTRQLNVEVPNCLDAIARSENDKSLRIATVARQLATPQNPDARQVLLKEQRELRTALAVLQRNGHVPCQESKRNATKNIAEMTAHLERAEADRDEAQRRLKDARRRAVDEQGVPDARRSLALLLDAYDAGVAQPSGSALGPAPVRMAQVKAPLTTHGARIAQRNSELAPSVAPTDALEMTILSCLRDKKYGGFRQLCETNGVAPGSDPKCDPSGSENDPYGTPHKSSITGASNGVLQYVVGGAACACTVKDDAMRGCQARAKNSVQDCPTTLRMTISAHEHRGASAFAPSIEVEPFRPNLVYKLVVQRPDGMEQRIPLPNGMGAVPLGNAATRGEFRIYAVAERQGGGCETHSNRETVVKTD